MDYDQARVTLDKLASTELVVPQRRNEATTRLQLIDAVLFEILGWPREWCVVEEEHDRQYADYVLGREARELIVEAKREESYFSLPEGFDARRPSLATLSSESPTFAKAFEQALQYCQSRGVAYGAVANGHQLVAFLSLPGGGRPPRASQGLAFYSWSDMQSDFRLLWDCLSPEGIEARRLTIELGGSPTPPPPEKMSAHIHAFPGFKERNQFKHDLRILGDLALSEDAFRESGDLHEEFLRHCFAPSGALSQYAMVGRDLLLARYAATGRVHPGEMVSATSTEGEVPTPFKEAATTGRPVMGGRPIILLGDVGVGKTTFLEHFVLVDAKDLLKDAILLKIDFGSGPSLSDDVRSHVLKKMDEQLVNEYQVDAEAAPFLRAVYHADLKRFAKSPAGELRELDPLAFQRAEIDFLTGLKEDRAENLKRALLHIVGTEQRLVLVMLDNVDQREPPFQDSVFLVAQTLASSWPVAVYVALRPSTFARSKAEGPLSAYHTRVFTIHPPRIDVVLRKRLTFAIDCLSDGRLPLQGVSFNVDLPTVREYLVMVRASLNRNPDLQEFLENLSRGNVRVALDFVKSFIGSGHVDTQKIQNVLTAGKNYIVPLHEFQRAVIYGEHEHYSPTTSPVANIFDLSQADPREHFLLPCLLLQIASLGRTLGYDHFVPPSDVYRAGQSLRFSAQQVAFAIERAGRKGLLELGVPDRNGGAEFLRVTAAGVYHVQKLCRKFTYVDAVIVDTPILRDAYRRVIVDVSHIGERLQRCLRFCDYLDDIWRDASLEEAGFDWLSASWAIRQDIERAEASYQRRARAGG